MARCLFARCRLFRGQPRPRASRGGFQSGFERSNSCDIALLPPQSTDEIGQVPGEDRPQPCRSLGVVSTAELVTLLIGLQQRLLYEIRRINQLVGSIAELHTSQEPQVFTVLFKSRRIGEISWVYREP